MIPLPASPAVLAHAAAHPPQDKAGPVLKPFQIRVLEEKQDLDVRCERLGEFIAGPLFKTLDPLERARMRRQAELMQELSTVLGARIGAFTPSQPA